MFTGIVQLIGRIERTRRHNGGQALTVALPGDWRKHWADWPAPGESISVSGVCLTVEPSSQDSSLTFFASQETLAKSTLGGRNAGDQVNIERAATPQSLLGGHLVSGHVDGRAVLKARRADGDAHILTFEMPRPLSRYLVEKGSIAIDGISLTAVNVQDNQFDVWIIPHTWNSTTLAGLEPGQEANVECDLMAKLVEKQLAGWLSSAGAPGGQSRNLAELLAQAGFKR